MSSEEIKKLKENFRRALVLSIVMTILVNTLSIFWAICGEAWFEDYYLYSASSFNDSNDKKHWIQVSTSETREPSPHLVKKLEFNRKESGENSYFSSIENIFQYVIQSIRELFKSIIEYFH